MLENYSQSFVRIVHSFAAVGKANVQKATLFVTACFVRSLIFFLK
ncbi:hypothetical protein X874_2260 [Mannheimia varigena USDA-ARS-USMARC-1312]|nr:hypothetical protein X874_2260 [Mannheimia varigena USDA-ARS-USMARC-1312]